MRWFVLFFGLLLLFSGNGKSVNAANRFNVLTYGTGEAGPGTTPVANLDSFYVSLDDFGASIYYSTYSQGFLNNRVQGTDTLGYDFFTSHFLDTLYIGSNNTFHIWRGLFQAIHFSWDGVNIDPVWGFRADVNQQIGTNVPENLFFPARSVRRALSSSDPAGLLHPPFDRGVFQNVPKSISTGTKANLSAWLRLGDDTGDTNTVVAQLILEDVRGAATWSANCDADSTSKYSVQILNDTFAIVGTSTGWDTVRVLDSHASRLVTSYCAINVALDTNTITWTNMCYVNPENVSDTICSLPYRYIKDLHIYDFDATNQYKEQSMSCRVRGGFAWYAYNVYWTGQRDMYLDSMALHNSTGDHFDALVNIPDSLAAVKTRIQDWYTSHNALNAVKGLYQVDEPTGGSFQDFARIKKIVDALDVGYPKDQMTTLGAYNTSVKEGLGGQYYDTYIRYSEQDHFLFDFYPNRCFVTSSSEVVDTHFNFQYQVVEGWGVPKKGIVPALEVARARADEMTILGDTMDFWVTLPTAASYIKSSQYGYIQDSRMLNAQELGVMVNMSLLYGAKGIGYWVYMGRGGCEYEPPFDCDTVPNGPVRRARYFEESGLLVDNFDAIDDYLVQCGCSTSTVLPYVFQGLMDRDANNNAVRTQYWYDAQAINQYLDSMAYFFNNAQWKSAGRWTDDLSLLNGSFIDSAKSFATYDSSYFQVGFFDYQNEPYMYLLNRRVDDGSLNQVDSQTVRIYLPDSPGVYEIWDVYANTADTVFDSSGIVMADIFLNPGEAKLIKRNLIRDSWSGTLTTSWTWPQFSTINIVGDITVPDSQTLTIQSPAPSMIGNSDTTIGGLDSNLTELIVEGTLRIEGTANDPVILTTSAGKWYGIRTSGTGTRKVVMDHAVIENALWGLYLLGDAADSVTNSRFENFSSYGVFSESVRSFV